MRWQEKKKNLDNSDYGSYDNPKSFVHCMHVSLYVPTLIEFSEETFPFFPIPHRHVAALLTKE
jgi:hypothetical protein